MLDILVIAGEDLAYFVACLHFLFWFRSLIIFESKILRDAEIFQPCKLVLIMIFDFEV
jgi:hypothetical protein